MKTMNTVIESDFMIQIDTLNDSSVFDINAAKRGLLLRMSHRWFEQGELRQAVDSYLRLCDEYPDTEEEKIAQARLLIIAQRYEQEGLLRLSLNILERLEQTI
jgi:hypothetical protein